MRIKYTLCAHDGYHVSMKVTNNNKIISICSIVLTNKLNIFSYLCNFLYLPATIYIMDVQRRPTKSSLVEKWDF